MQLNCVSKHEDGIPSLIMFSVSSEKPSPTAVHWSWCWNAIFHKMTYIPHVASVKMWCLVLCCERSLICTNVHLCTHLLRSFLKRENYLIWKCSCLKGEKCTLPSTYTLHVGGKSCSPIMHFEISSLHWVLFLTSANFGELLPLHRPLGQGLEVLCLHSYALPPETLIICKKWMHADPFWALKFHQNVLILYPW